MQRDSELLCCGRYAEDGVGGSGTLKWGCCGDLKGVRGLCVLREPCFASVKNIYQYMVEIISTEMISTGLFYFCSRLGT